MDYMVSRPAFNIGIACERDKADFDALKNGGNVMNKDFSLNDKELKNISGGVTNQGVEGNDAERASGITCPNCGGFVPVSKEQLLHGSPVFCPNCNFRIIL